MFDELVGVAEGDAVDDDEGEVVDDDDGVPEFIMGAGNIDCAVVIDPMPPPSFPMPSVIKKSVGKMSVTSDDTYGFKLQMVMAGNAIICEYRTSRWTSTSCS